MNVLLAKSGKDFIQINRYRSGKAVLGQSIDSCSAFPLFYFYFNGTYILDLDAPMPGVPCMTFLFVIMNSPM